MNFVYERQVIEAINGSARKLLRANLRSVCPIDRSSDEVLIRRGARGRRRRLATEKSAAWHREPISRSATTAASGRGRGR